MDADDPTRMAITSAVTSPIPLVGRTAEIAHAEALIRDAHRALLVSGPPGSGRTRLAQEIADRLGSNGARYDLSGADRDPRHEALRIVAATDRQPVVLCGDVDRGVDEFAVLAHEFGQSGGYLIGTVDYDGPTPAHLPIVRVGPLDDAASRELADMIAPNLHGEHLADCLGAAEGLPLLIVALATKARDLDSPDEAWRLPSTVHEYVDRRLVDADGAVIDDLEQCACFLGEWSLGDFRDLIGTDDRDAATRLDNLAQAGLIVEAWRSDSHRFRIAPPAVGLALVERIRPVERRLRIAAAYSVASDAAPDQRARMARTIGLEADAARHSVMAARLARHAGSVDVALMHADRALRWAGRDEVLRVAALAERGLTLHRMASWTEATEALEKAIPALEPDAGRVWFDAIWSNADAYWKMGERARALSAMDHALLPDPATDEVPGWVEAAAQAAILNTLAGRGARGCELARRALAVAARHPDASAARARIALGHAEIRRGAGSSAFVHLQHGTGEARVEGDLRLTALGLNNQVYGLLGLGRPNDAFALIDEGVAIAREIRSPELDLVLQTNKGECHLWLGRLDDARTTLERAARGWRSLHGERDVLAHTEPYLAWLVVAEGRFRDACERYEALWPTVLGGTPIFEQLAPLYTGYVVAAWEAGDRDRAEFVCHRAVDEWNATDDRLDVIPLLAVAALLLREDPAAPSWARDLASMIDNASAAHRGFAAMANVATPANGDAGPACLAEAAAHFHVAGFPLWAAMAQYWSSTMWPDDPNGEDLLRQARLAFRDLGASGWRAKCEAEMRRRGIRARSPGRPPREPGALSAREQEVLTLVAAGLTTSEIAERLFISPKTVRRHLEGIFRTLGVRSRLAAVEAARRSGHIPAMDDANP